MYGMHTMLPEVIDVDTHVTIMKYFGELKIMFFCDGNRMCLKYFEEEMQ